MEEKLHEAAVSGDLALLNEILVEDSLALHRIKVGCFLHTPLHVAAMWGHSELVEKMVRINPSLCNVVDHRRWSPLHLASYQGHHLLVEPLVLSSNPEMCVSLDDDGKTPLHLAAMWGHEEVLREFFRVRAYMANTFLDAKDGRGNTILHLAVEHHHYEVVRYLLTIVQSMVTTRCLPRKKRAFDAINIRNLSGYTALDLIVQSQDDAASLGELRNNFTKVGALTSEDQGEIEEMLMKGKSLIIVASLIATVAFQFGVNPPGGVWQDTTDSHRAGEAIMAYYHPYLYRFFVHTSTIGLTGSATTFSIIMTGWPVKRTRLLMLISLLMCVTIFTMMVTYTLSVFSISPEKDTRSLTIVGVTIWCCFGGVFFLRLALRLIGLWMKSKGVSNVKHLFVLRIGGRGGQSRRALDHVP